MKSKIETDSDGFVWFRVSGVGQQCVSRISTKEIVCNDWRNWWNQGERERAQFRNATKQ